MSWLAVFQREARRFLIWCSSKALDSRTETSADSRTSRLSVVKKKKESLIFIGSDELLTRKPWSETEDGHCHCPSCTKSRKCQRRDQGRQHHKFSQQNLCFDHQGRAFAFCPGAESCQHSRRECGSEKAACWSQSPLILQQSDTALFVSTEETDADTKASRRSCKEARVMSMSSKCACCEHTLVSSSLRTRLFFTAWATLATEALLRTLLLSRTLSNMLPAFLAPTSTWIVDVSALRQHSIHLLLDDRGVASRVHNHAQEDPVNHGKEQSGNLFSSSFLSSDKH